MREHANENSRSSGTHQVTCVTIIDKDIKIEFSQLTVMVKRKGRRTPVEDFSDNSGECAQPVKRTDRYPTQVNSKKLFE
jgi:hypothetical protein